MSEGQYHGITWADNHHFAHSATSVIQELVRWEEPAFDKPELIFYSDILSYGKGLDVAWNTEV